MNNNLRRQGEIHSDGHIIGLTRQCCHCGKHWEIKIGSGKTRGYCGNCRQDHCGAPWCFICVPYQVQLEFMEGNMDSVTKKYYLPYLEILRLKENAAKTNPNP